MGINVKTGPIVASYAYVWKPRPNKSGILKFSCCLLISKKNASDIKAYEAAVRAAFEEGVEKGMFSKNQWSIVKKPMRDGDKEIELGIKKVGIGYEGVVFMNANANEDQPPEITKPLNGKVVAITDQSEFYSGCECRAAISFYPFNTDGSRGIAVGLNALFKTGDGKRLDGRESAQSAFSDFAAEHENLEGDSAQIAKDSSEPFDN